MTGDFFVCGCGISPCVCYRQTTVQPVWIGDNTSAPKPPVPVLPCNPPANPLVSPQISPGNVRIDPLGGWSSGNFSISPGTTFKRHEAFKKGQLALINWSLVKGVDAVLYEDESKFEFPGGATTWISAGISHRKQLHLFEGREAVILLDDVNEFAGEARISWGDKVGWVNAYLLLSIEDESELIRAPRRNKKKASRKPRNV